MPIQNTEKDLFAFHKKKISQSEFMMGYVIFKQSGIFIFLYKKTKVEFYSKNN